MKLTHRECRLIELLRVAQQWTTFEVERKTDREYDLAINGKSTKYGSEGGFSAWAILAAIQGLTDWTRPSVAGMSDYPDMAMGGDWSGIRDTDDGKLWAMFYAHVEPKLT